MTRVAVIPLPTPPTPSAIGPVKKAQYDIAEDARLVVQPYAPASSRQLSKPCPALPCLHLALPCPASCPSVTSLGISLLSARSSHTHTRFGSVAAKQLETQGAKTHMRHHLRLLRFPAIPAAVLFVANLVVALFVFSAGSAAAKTQAPGFLELRGSTSCLKLSDTPGCDLGFSCA